jgi:hypothetical protein
MIVGTIFLGKVKEVNKQWIETKFFILGLPLFPLSSMLVTSSEFRSRQGMPIPLNTTSVIAGYGRLLTFLVGIVLFVFGLSNPENDPFNITLAITGAALLALWFFLFFKFGKATEEESSVRSKIGNAIGVYAMPNWFDFDTSYNCYKDLEFRYFDRFATKDWKADIEEGHLSAEKLSIIYPLALFNQMIDQSTESERLLHKAEQMQHQKVLSQQ